MRFLLITFLICFTVESFSNNLKNILNKSESDSISKGFEISKYTKNFDHMDGWEGALKIKSLNNKLIYCMVGEWKSYYQGTNKLKAYFLFDSIGCLVIYNEYTKAGFKNYDCEYSKKQLGNSHYLIETIKYYYENGQLCETGQRIQKVEYTTGYIKHLNSFRKFGKWIRYYDDGSLEYQKQYKEMKIK